MGGITDPQQPSRAAFRLLLIALVVLGSWLRLRNLGALGLILDEGAQALAVRGILEHGLPITDSGLVYGRSLSFLYFQALFCWLFDLDAFWLRLPSVILGVASIVAVYHLARALFDRRVGLLAVAIMTFSVWEIEFSRYGRFYTAFQLAYVLLLICFYRGLIQGERGWKLGFVPASLTLLTTHFLSRVFVINFGVPLFSRTISVRRKGFFLLGAVAFYASWLVYERLTDWLLNLGERLPQATAEAVSETVARSSGYLIPLPALPDLSVVMQIAAARPLVPVAFSFVAVVAACYLVLHALRAKLPSGPLILALSIIASSVAGLFVVAVLLGMMYAVLFLESAQDIRKPVFSVPLAVTALAFVCWLALALSEPSLSGEQITMALAGYPNVMRYFLHRFVSGWPIMAAVTLVGVVWLLGRHVQKPTDPASWFVVGSLVLPLAATSLFDAHAETRYFFHLYPVIAIVCAFAIAEFSSWVLRVFSWKGAVREIVVLSAVTVAVLLLSQDANPVSAWQVGNRSYETRKDPVRSITNLEPYASFHQDQEGASRYVATKRQPGDRVVVLGSVFKLRVYQFYVGTVDYLVTPSLNQLRMHDGRRITPMTGTEVLGDVEQLNRVLADSASGLWILGDRLILTGDSSHGFVGCGGEVFGPCWDVYAPDMRAYLSELTNGEDYLGRDGVTFAKRIY